MKEKKEGKAMRMMREMVKAVVKAIDLVLGKDYLDPVSRITMERPNLKYTWLNVPA